MVINDQVLVKFKPSILLDEDPINKELKTHNFYNFPKYYDMAFTRDVTNDIRFFQNCFKDFTNLEIKRVLEPACGPGMFLEEFPKFGYYTVGYDLNSSMVEYSKERLKKAGLTEKDAKVLVGNMKDLIFEEKFDAAIICINSLGYLTSSTDIHSHFRAMYNSLNDGGLYIVEISCMCEDIKNEKKVDDIWNVKDNGIELELIWKISWYDVPNRIRHVDFRMKGIDHGREFIVEEPHELRLWFFDEFKMFAETNGFKVVGIYNQKYEKIDYSCKINGELGALFFILKKE